MAAPARKKFKVTHGNSHISVYPYGKGWRYAWRETRDAAWRYVTSKTKAEAEASATLKLEELDRGGIVWSSLDREALAFHEAIHRDTTPADWPAILAFIKARRKSAEIVAAVARFMEWKIATAGEETPYLARVRGILEGMATAFKGREVAEVHAPDLLEWWKARGAGKSAKRQKDIRADLVAFWSWARREGIAGADPVTPAERIPAVSADHGERRVLTIDEIKKLLLHVDQEFRAWVVLGAFAGLRPEEIAPPTKGGSKKKKKRGLHCEEIDWTFGVIRVPAVVSKVGFPRVLPMSDACRAGLEWAGIKPGMTGPVCMKNPSDEKETLRLGKVVFTTGWPQDALRHSYGSYRNAVVRSLPQVAEEMGTSVTMLNRHYHNPKAEAEGAEWFALRPGAIRFDPISGDLMEESGERAAG